MHIPRAFRNICLVTDMNTHTWKILFVNEFKLNTNTYTSKNAGNSNCIYSRAHGTLHVLIGLETEGPADLQGRAGITSIVCWNIRPVIFGVDKTSFQSFSTGKSSVLVQTATVLARSPLRKLRSKEV